MSYARSVVIYGGRSVGNLRFLTKGKVKSRRGPKTIQMCSRWYQGATDYRNTLSG